jgi:guanylate kinase
MRNKKIFIIGGGGSGKDYLRRKFEAKGYTFGIFHTTRPKRSNETEGSDYFYTNNHEFKKIR